MDGFESNESIVLEKDNRKVDDLEEFKMTDSDISNIAIQEDHDEEMSTVKCETMVLSEGLIFDSLKLQLVKQYFGIEDSCLEYLQYKLDEDEEKMDEKCVENRAVVKPHKDSTEDFKDEQISNWIRIGIQM